MRMYGDGRHSIDDARARDRARVVVRTMTRVGERMEVGRGAVAAKDSGGAAARPRGPQRIAATGGRKKFSVGTVRPTDRRAQRGENFEGRAASTDRPLRAARRKIVRVGAVRPTDRRAQRGENFEGRGSSIDRPNLRWA